jgi:ligand-binding sensor domain-containing protein
VVVLFICIPFLKGISQSSHLIFEHLTKENGLSSDKVTTIIQDREGFYWIATVNGLNRFDGSSFKIFTHKKGDSTSIAHNHCTALLEDDHGDIWVGTYYGLCKYIKSKGYFQSISLPNSTGAMERDNSITELVKDKYGDIWIGGDDLWKCNMKSDSITLYRKKNADPTSRALFQVVKHLKYDRINDGVWFSSGLGVIYFSNSKQTFFHKGYNPLRWKIFDEAEGYEMTIDGQDRIWFRDRKTQSLSVFDTPTNTITPMHKKIVSAVKRICADEKNRIWIFFWSDEAEIFDPQSGVSDTNFFSSAHSRSVLNPINNNLFIDSKGNYWISSNDGINLYNAANQYYTLHYMRTTGKPNNDEALQINAMAQSEPGYVWLGTNAGLYQYNLLTGEEQHVNIPSPIKHIPTLLADGDTLWVGVHNLLMCLDIHSKTVLKSWTLQPGIYFIRKGTQNDIWIGLWTKGLYRLHTRTGQFDLFTIDTTNASSMYSNSTVTGLAVNDTFWVGYNGGAGFSSYAIPSATWTHFTPKANNISDNSLGTITVILHTVQKQLWFGTHGGGIFRFDPATNQYQNFDQNDGLYSNYINSIMQDEGGRLWISTADGINYLNTTTRRIHALNMDFVFANNDFAPNGIRGLQGKLYFFWKNKIIEVDPSLYNPDHTFPSLVISSFTIFDKEKALPRNQEQIKLTHQENYFSFGFSAIKTHPLKKATYAYILEGFDKTWIFTNTPFAHYTNVPDGNYFFKVKAANDEGEWSDPLLNLPIHIKPPFWRTWWFITLSIVFMISGAYLFYQYRIQQIKKLFAVRTKISQDLHDEVGSTLSSIHVYSSVAAKAMNTNPEATRNALQQIKQNSQEVMENMSDIVWAINTGNNGQMSLGDKLKNYGYELLNPLGINCIYAIDANAEKKLVNIEARKNVLLIAKEAMNNIAKYSAATEARIQLGITKGYLQLKITDNGRGFNPDSSHKGNGLYNMQHRITSLGGTFHLEAAEGQGTTIHCRIPLTSISDTWSLDHP